MLVVSSVERDVSRLCGFAAARVVFAYVHCLRVEEGREWEYGVRFLREALVEEGEAGGEGVEGALEGVRERAARRAWERQCGYRRRFTTPEVIGRVIEAARDVREAEVWTTGAVGFRVGVQRLASALHRAGEWAEVRGDRPGMGVLGEVRREVEAAGRRWGVVWGVRFEGERLASTLASMVGLGFGVGRGEVGEVWEWVRAVDGRLGEWWGEGVGAGGEDVWVRVLGVVVGWERRLQGVRGCGSPTKNPCT